MATVSDWSRYRQLRDLIAQAIDEAWDNEEWGDGEMPETFNVVISPTLDKAYATSLPWWDDEVLSEKISEGWFLESADTAEELIERADLYFDLR